MNVSDYWHVWPMLFKHLLAILVLFAKCHCFDSGPGRRQTEPADAGKKIKQAHYLPNAFFLGLPVLRFLTLPVSARMTSAPIVIAAFETQPSSS